MGAEEPKKSLRERIAEGECVSEWTTEKCPVCVDRCQAHAWMLEIKKATEKIKS